MTTYSFQGFVRNGSIVNNADVKFTVKDNDNNFSYSVLQSGSGQLPKVQLEGISPYHMVGEPVFGSDLNLEGLDTYIGDITWGNTGQFSTTILVFDDPTRPIFSPTRAYIALSGDPLPDDASGMVSLIESITASSGISSGPFAPGQSIDLATLPDLRTIETDVIMGSAANDTYYGGISNDSIYGEAGGDRLYGEDGLDDLFGGTGRDYLFGGNGSDLLDGGDYHDKLFGGAGEDTITGGKGNDTAYGGTEDDQINGGNMTDRLFGGDGNDKLVGARGRDYLYGGDNNDRLFGNDYHDSLYGGNYHDSLYGGKGDDQLFGGNGSDFLTGGLHTDQMTGGNGADIFHFNDGDDQDTITDFQNNFDTIELDNFDFTSVSQALSFATEMGNDVVFNFGGGDTLTVLNTNKGSLFSDIDIM